MGKSKKNITLAPPPRPIPWQWKFWLLTCPYALTAGALWPIGLITGYFLPGNIKSLTGCEAIIGWGTILFFCLISLIYPLKKLYYLRYGISVKAKTLSSEETKYVSEGPATIYHGWDKIEEYSDVSLFKKELEFTAKNGEKVKFTSNLWKGEGPMYLYNPKRPKKFLGINKLLINVWVSPDGLWLAKRQNGAIYMLSIMSIFTLLFCIFGFIYFGFFY